MAERSEVQLGDIECPALAAGVERRDFGSYGVLAPPGAGSVLRLEPDEILDAGPHGRDSNRS